MQIDSSVRRSEKRSGNTRNNRSSKRTRYNNYIALIAFISEISLSKNNSLKNNLTKNGTVNSTDVGTGNNLLEFSLGDLLANFRPDQSNKVEILLKEYIIQTIYIMIATIIIKTINKILSRYLYILIKDFPKESKN